MREGFDGEAQPGTAMPARARRSDAGTSLVEIVITVALMGTIVVALLLATRTSIRASATARGAAEVETLIVNVADRINRADMGCNYSTYAWSAARTAGWTENYDQLIKVTHQYYVPATYLESPKQLDQPGRWLPETPVPSLCDIDTGNLPVTVQRVYIDITSPEGVRRSLEVVKSSA